MIRTRKRGKGRRVSGETNPSVRYYLRDHPTSLKNRRFNRPVRFLDLISPGSV